jgi:pimeloyl-ACP methyl ester carboxylesterase
METVNSKDGTRIAFERMGSGPALILVMGAFNDRSTGRPLASFLAPDFTAITYDRRGRGESGDTASYEVEREVEDLEALIGKVGGEAFVFGYSSGAVLSLKAAARGLGIKGLALYEPPFSVNRSEPKVDHAAALDGLVRAGRRGEAVEYFQREVVGIPAQVVAHLRGAPFRAGLEEMAHTLVYDMTIVGDGSVPAKAKAMRVPVLAMDGEKSPDGLREGAGVAAAVIPGAEHRSLPGQNHDLVREAVGPVLKEFFAR